jgi:hypothetical protein
MILGAVGPVGPSGIVCATEAALQCYAATSEPAACILLLRLARWKERRFRGTIGDFGRNRQVAVEFSMCIPHWLLSLLSLLVPSLVASAAEYRLTVRVMTLLEYRNTPFDPEIDFGELLRDRGDSGMLDPNSIRVYDVATGRRIPHALSSHFHYGDPGGECNG